MGKQAHHQPNTKKAKEANVNAEVEEQDYVMDTLKKGREKEHPMLHRGTKRGSAQGAAVTLVRPKAPLASDRIEGETSLRQSGGVLCCERGRILSSLQ